MELPELSVFVGVDTRDEEQRSEDPSLQWDFQINENLTSSSDSGDEFMPLSEDEDADEEDEVDAEPKKPNKRTTPKRSKNARKVVEFSDSTDSEEFHDWNIEEEEEMPISPVLGVKRSRNGTPAPRITSNDAKDEETLLVSLLSLIPPLVYLTVSMAEDIRSTRELTRMQSSHIYSEFLPKGLLKSQRTWFRYRKNNNLDSPPFFIRRRPADKTKNECLEKFRTQFGPKVVILDITRHGEEPWIKFCPMYPHGCIPIPFSRGKQGMSVEGIWEALKVFENEDIDLSKLGISDFLRMKRKATDLRGPLKGLRRGPNTKSDIVTLQQARRGIYFPLYKRQLDTYLQQEIAALKHLIDSGAPVIILDSNTTTAATDAFVTDFSCAFLLKLYMQGEYPRKIKI